MSHAGNLIRTVRIKRGIKQTYIGKRLKYSSQFVANWERAVSFPPLSCAKELCEILSLPRSKLKAALLKDYKAKLNEAF